MAWYWWVLIVTGSLLLIAGGICVGFRVVIDALLALPRALHEGREDQP